MAVKGLERAGGSAFGRDEINRTEDVYRRYVIVCEADLAQGLNKFPGQEHPF